MSQLKQGACASCGTGNRLPDGRDPSAAKFGARGIPALFLVEVGKVHARHAGLMPAEAIVQWIESS